MPGPALTGPVAARDPRCAREATARAAHAAGRRMNRPQRPQLPSPGYDQMDVHGSWFGYQEALRDYQVAMLEYVASMLEAATRRPPHIEASER